MTPRRALVRAWALLVLAAWATAAIARASMMVARDILAPTGRVSPAVLIVPSACRSHVETAVFAGLTTLIPGTLTVAVRDDLHEIWVHGIYGSDPERLRAEMLDLQLRVLRALRAPDEVEVTW